MAQYPLHVQLAWKAVETFVTDWGRNPCYWEQEVDVQAELRSRLTSAFSVLGLNEVIADEIDSQARKTTFRYSRVACEPSIQYVFSDGKTYRAMPDVVIWDDLEDPKVHPEPWPILWACEIKYVGAGSSEWDVEKLGYLVDQNLIRFGCWLTFQIDNTLTAPVMSWDKGAHGTRLWTCSARAAARPSVSLGVRE
jgi:hypothetical protein